MIDLAQFVLPGGRFDFQKALAGDVRKFDTGESKSYPYRGMYDSFSIRSKDSQACWFYNMNSKGNGFYTPVAVVGNIEKVIRLVPYLEDELRRIEDEHRVKNPELWTRKIPLCSCEIAPQDACFLHSRRHFEVYRTRDGRATEKVYRILPTSACVQVAPSWLSGIPSILEIRDVPEISDPYSAWRISRCHSGFARGQRNGTEILTWVCGEADAEGIVLVLEASPWDKERLNDLLRFYERFGFVFGEGDFRTLGVRQPGDA